MEQDRLRAVVPLLLILVALAAPPLVAQDGAGALRDGFGVAVGGLWYASPDEQCAAGNGLSAGIEARTRGVWFLAGAADLLLGGVGVCTLRGEVADWRGRQVEVDRTASLRLAPRVTLRVGRAIQVGSSTWTPGVGIGVLYLRTDFRTDNGWTWSPWYGASLSFETRALPASLHVEYGSLAFPVRYYDGGDAQEVVHEFRRPVPALRLTLVL